MYKLLIINLLSLTLLAGCGGGDEAVPAPSPTTSTPPQGASLANLTSTSTTAAAPASPAPAPFAEDFSQPTPVEKGSSAPTEDLERLNQVVARYLDPAAHPGAGDVDVQINIKPINSVEDLVKVGWIKKAPTPPAGKTYQFDKASQKFVLADRK